MPNDLSGAELDSRFFEVCLPSRMARIGVSTDATVCEAWAMRWARENGLHWRIDQHNDECRVELWRLDGRWYAYGTDYKEAFVRACVAAGEALNQSRGGA